jgi:predicted nucleic-acid-binding protein
MLAVDTNVLVRLITNDEPKQALRAQQALDAELNTGSGTLWCAK